MSECSSSLISVFCLVLRQRRTKLIIFQDFEFGFVHRALTIFIIPAVISDYGQILPRQQPITRDLTGINHIINLM